MFLVWKSFQGMISSVTWSESFKQAALDCTSEQLIGGFLNNSSSGVKCSASADHPIYRVEYSDCQMEKFMKAVHDMDAGFNWLINTHSSYLIFPKSFSLQVHKN